MNRQDIRNSVILVVDDTPTNLEVLSEALTDAGYEVGVATSGNGAIEQVEYMAPDLILLDVQMPGIDGFETCRRLKESPKTVDIPVIFMTALSDSTDKVKGLSLGAVDYITKPFQQEEVLARVQIHLQLRHMAKTLETQNYQLKQLKENLEDKVAQRTADLQKTQVQLVQKEKLSALGELVAGVAHEINNPVSCIASNIPMAKQYIEDITSIVRLYQRHYPTPAVDILEESENVDLEFLLEDLPKILNSMESGASRIREISASLRNFSRADHSVCVEADVHEGLDSTLMILHHRLKACGDRPSIHVSKQYGNVPKIECYPGLLNQVFMNILSNAIDALEEAFEKRSLNGNGCAAVLNPMIHICTDLIDGHTVQIRIADNGPGMTEQVQQALFNPFFTTKSIGKGTGLGMSISQQIISEKHEGTLTCVSVPGQGAEFIIEIPMRQLCPR